MTGPVLLLSFLWAALGASPPGNDYDAQLLRKHNLPAEGPGLLDFFRQRTPTAEHAETFHRHLAKLSSDSYTERARATDDLLKMGPAVRPLLVQVLNDPPADPETRRRVEKCLVGLPDKDDVVPALATARRIAVQKPAGAVSVLLDYLPFVSHDLVRQEVQSALNDVAFDQGRPAPALLDALRAPEAVKRAAAAEALVRGGKAEANAQVEPLLRDTNAQVRLQAGLALAEAGHKAAVPVLIDLLGELPRDRAWSALDLLLRLADETGGELPPTLDGTRESKDVAAAWRQWWQRQAGSLDPARLAAPSKEEGFTLLAHASKGLNGKLVELDPDGKVCWKLEGLRYPLDVRYLGKNRLLVVEYYGRCVTERDRKGQVLWEKKVTSSPIAAQRLPGGQTFIACRNHLCVVDRDGRETFSVHHRAGTIHGAGRLPDGRTVLAHSGGSCLVLDPTGAVVKTFKIGSVYVLGGNIDVSPDGRVLVPEYNANRIAEYDLEGNLLWSVSVPHPAAVTRLANGNLLAVNPLQRVITEIDRQGQRVWTHKVEGRPWRALRR